MSEINDIVKQQGKVKWFNNARGYGFIECSNTEEDIFVHYRNIISDGYKSLSEGQMVEFTLAKGDKGLQAEDVETIILDDIKTLDTVAEIDLATKL